MFKKSAIAAVAILVSATAFSASASEQFADSLNVAPGSFTTAELIQLRDAREDNNKAKESFILAKADATSRASGFTTADNSAALDAYLATNNTNDDNHSHQANVAAKLNGEYYVPADVTARAQAAFDAYSD